MSVLDGKRVLVTGGTGSVGQALVRRLLGEKDGLPQRVTVFSRDESKQHQMRLAYNGRGVATDDIIYENSRQRLAFAIGDVRDYSAVRHAVLEADIVFHAAALKQVPTCEYFPVEAVHTNVGGAENIVRAIREGGTSVELVVGISTDKACKPVNVMGMTKALQERILIEANRDIPNTRFICVRYGNVVASRGSIVPLFVEQIERGGPVTITVKEMTRFMIGLEQAVDTIFDAMNQALPGQTFVPQIPSCRVVDIARILMHGQDIPVTYTGIRPGEKIHEILVSEEECSRTFSNDGYYVIDPALPELRGGHQGKDGLDAEYSSADGVLSLKEVDDLFVGFDAAETLETSL